MLAKLSGNVDVTKKQHQGGARNKRSSGAYPTKVVDKGLFESTESSTENRALSSTSDGSPDDPDMAGFGSEKLLDDADGQPPQKRFALSDTANKDAATANSMDYFEGHCNRRSCAQSAQIVKESRDKINKMTAEMKTLQEDNCRLRELNMLLQESLVKRSADCSFTEEKGYPKAEWLLSISQNSGDSDYLFIKELLLNLFPEGVGNATATGRPSNNPKGRSKDAENPDDPMQTSKMDPKKVKYMKGKVILILKVLHLLLGCFTDRLYERRRILQDAVGTAVEKSKLINRHIANAIANNPSLRNTPKKQ